VSNNCMKSLKWDGPFVLRQYLTAMLDMQGTWPSLAPGVYVVTMKPWKKHPTSDDGPVYVGGTGNLLERIGNFMADVLGFYGEGKDGTSWVGRHSGAQSLWKSCHDEKKKVGDLVLGWAPTSIPCHWCMERDVFKLLNPKENRKRRVGRQCCCPS
jgi:hypothetical protein